MRSLLSASLILVTACGSSQAPTRATVGPEKQPAEAGPPVAAVRPVTNTYHGVDVVDPYQWLEKDDDPEVKAWADGQNRYAREQLQALPNLAAVRAQVEKLVLDPSPSYFSVTFVGGHLFMEKQQPPKEQPTLIEMSDKAGLTGERVILDPTVLDKDGTMGIDFYEPSPDGSKVAVSLSKGGSERGDLVVYDVATAKPLPDQIAHVNNGTAGGSVAWLPDGSGFYYTRYPRDGERPKEDLGFYQQVWLHTLGQPVETDRYIFGKGQPRIAETRVAVDDATRRLLITVQNGDGGDFAHYLGKADGSGKLTQLLTFGDGIKGVFFGPPKTLFALSRKDAPRGKLLALTGGATDMSKAVEIVPQSKDSIAWNFWGASGILPTDSRIYVIYQTGGPTVLRVFDHEGKPLPAPEQLPVASISGLEQVAGDDIWFTQTSDLVPWGWYELTAKGTRKLDQISRPALVDLSDAEVVREMATSKDGTKVPVDIIVAKNAPRDGSRPCIVTGYGGYGSSQTPHYRALARIFLDRGVCFAVANLRGGGEFGEEWHREGMLTKKQNVFDDFTAVLQHMISRGYTSSKHLGIIGGSNGGLLMGAEFTQHPDLMAAVVSAVGIYDSLRTELSPNGEFNVTEFGTVKDPDQFKALYAYSPYHHVEAGVKYPPILFTTGDNDPRVESWQSRKMTARLQAASSSGAPILLRTSASAGHGASKLSGVVDEIAVQFAFLLHYIGAPEPAVK